MNVKLQAITTLLGKSRLPYWLAAALAMLCICGPAQAQVVLLVTGDPITAYDIDQRMKLNQMFGGRNATRPEVVEELINDKLKIQAAKRFNFEIGDSDVEGSFASVARNVGLSPEQFSQQLQQRGISPNTLKARLKADATWGQIVRGRFQSTLQVGEKDIFEAEASRNEPKETGIEYMLYPITFVLPRNSPPAMFEARKKEAERARFQDCASGLKFARALREVVVRAPVRRNTADLSPQLREILAKVDIGKVTPPEQTSGGVEVFALCEKKETNSDSPTKRKLRDEMFSERFKKQADRYLKELRGQAMIEYKKAE
jgi:peptidyl-prolyl cis-trans isomerase SurA